jgi:putative pyoverdin transport system ATP-binding/permease protein
MKPLFRFLSRDRPAFTRVVLFSAAAALCELLASLAAIDGVLAGHRSFHVRVTAAVVAVGFALLFLIACRRAFRCAMMLSETTCDDLLLRLADRVRDAELSALERIGGENLLNGLSRDTSALLDASWLSLVCLFLVANVILPIIYVLFLSPLSVLLLFIVALASLPMLLALGRAQIRREAEAAGSDLRFLRLADQMIAGFLWFKMDRHRSRDLTANHLWPGVEAARRASVSSSKLYVLNIAVIDFLIMLTIATIAYVVSFEGVDAGAVTVLALLLCAWGATNEILAVFPSLIGAAGALDRLQMLEDQLVTANRPARGAAIRRFERIEFEAITYEYRAAATGSALFQFGPVTTDLRRGEIVFIVGGNGSGKSTFTKIITGLYSASSGLIRVDGRPVGPSSLRSLYGGVMADFHLFDQCYGLEGVDEKLSGRLLERFGLSRVTALRDGKFSTRDLSTGQRKRLALVIAVLEDRPILLYDEWAADQDPDFRDLFYREILAEQRAHGTTIIAVTHDDRYFDCADRIIRMDAGRIAAGGV